MIKNKKKINKIKTETFLEKFPILFLLQQNNFTVNDWFDFKQKIQEIQDQSDSKIKNLENGKKIEILNIKNSVFKKILETSTNVENSKSNSLSSILQGPNFIIGCENDAQLNSIWKCVRSNKKLVFISCLYQNQLINHLDLEILLKANSSVYQTLLHQFDKKTELYSVLNQNLTLRPLISVQLDFLNVLNVIKEKK